ncbi:glycoside hydrolase superfamily [Massariosphaeria phaeospora]|uniref:glucan endo-1,6-beta-glucosidase n=1 Tax=Massariosphaeria phaeospora TaxID=100035 RepID=A0A7C8ICY5_9PLEO|nr:glycoside hydrolase superfamily [Massariosphaeria phaeospora]
MKAGLLPLLALCGAVAAWLPHDKLRGVNLGSLFVVEPWMMMRKWESMGCGSLKSELECVSKLGQETADKAFRDHWETWVTEQDMDEIKKYGLNTIRVPLGHWIVESTVQKPGEQFPRGGMAYLDRLASWATAKQLYVILDLHGAPAAQTPQQPSTGQFVSTAGFFEPDRFNQAYAFLQAMTEHIHTNAAYNTTGTIQVLNEPVRDYSQAPLLLQYYATAYEKIREVEKKLGVSKDKRLTVQFMDKTWGAGNPKDVMSGKHGVAYDNHRYLKYAPVQHTKESYLSTSCGDSFGEAGNTPIVIGEWSLGVESSVEKTAEWEPTREQNKAFYTKWWAAQVVAYEKQAGWVFWSWKTQLGGDWRWSYSAAVKVGVLPEDAGKAAELSPC